MEKNLSKRFIIGVVVALLAFVSGISYAYFTAIFSNVGERETTLTSASVGSIRLVAEAATYTSDYQYPGEMTVQKFYIEPVGEGKGIYEIDLASVLPSVFGSDIEISLYKAINNEEVTVTKGELVQTNSGMDYNYSRVDTLDTDGLTSIYQGTLRNGENILVQEDFEVINSSGLKIRENSSSPAYSRYTYYLVYNYKDHGSQNDQMGQMFSGTVSAKLIAEKNLSESHEVSFAYIDSNANCTLTKAFFENHELESLAEYDCYSLQEIGSITSGTINGGFYTEDIEELLDDMFFERTWYYDESNPSNYVIDSVNYLYYYEYENIFSEWTYDNSEYSSHAEALGSFDGDLVLYSSDLVPVAQPYAVTFVNLDAGMSECISALKVTFDENGDPLDATPISCSTGEEGYFDDYSVYDVLDDETDYGSKSYYYDAEMPDYTIDITDSYAIDLLIADIDNYAFNDYSDIDFGLGEMNFTLYHIEWE